MVPQPDRHRPERTCVQCGAKGHKDGFFRIAGRPGKGWEPDPAARRPGRGIYLCRGTGCIGSFARRIRTPKGARRFRMGASAASLADSLEEGKDGA
ncbi:MAG: DUF448 domain-containing protein [Deltaproteobacteria bacterium]|nr:DUF448 domain-containing protein [Deltaproteobacteria bacterium]